MHRTFEGKTTVPYDDIDQLVQEHGALLHLYKEVQQRCTEQMRDQTREIERLQAVALRLRAQAIVLESTLAWERENRLTLAAALAAQTMRAVLLEPDAARADRDVAAPEDSGPEGHASAPTATGSEQEMLESSLRAADLVICQTGCVSDGAYWRVEDHCKRTGKPCVLVEQPNALRILRLRADGEDGQVVAAQASIGGLR